MSEASDDLTSVAWVHEELRRSLEAAHKALRRFRKEAEAVVGSDVDAVDPSVLRSARAQLHQGVGALELVGLPAAALVLRASEALVQRAAGKPELLTPSVLSDIERASFALLDYLGRMLAGKTVSPLSLFPQYRALQDAGEASRFHPADLWSVDWRWRDLPVDARATPRPPDAALREAFERQLLALLRDREPRVAARHIGDACADLGAGAVAPQVATLWKLASAVFEAHAEGLLPFDVFTKRVASRLLSQLRVLERGEHDVSERLARDLLFFCSQSRPPGPSQAARLAATRDAYALAAGAPVDYSVSVLGRFDPALITQAKKRVASAKEAWSAVAGGEMHRLGGLGEQFSLVADSLRRLFPLGESFGNELQQAVGQTQQAQAAPPVALAMEVATSLLYTEAALEDADFDDPEHAARVARLAERLAHVRLNNAPDPLEGWMEELYRRVSDRQTMGSVVQELRSSLAEAETAIDQFFRNPADASVLIPVPQQMASMRGVLCVLGMDEASAALLHMRTEIEALAAPGAGVESQPGDAVFGRLAANLSALGFLIDMLSVQPHVAKSLFVYDAVQGTLSPVMGRSAEAEHPDQGEAVLAPAVEPRLIEQAQLLAFSSVREDVALQDIQTDLERLSLEAQAADQPALAAAVTKAQDAFRQSDDPADISAARAELSEALVDFVATSSEADTLAPSPSVAPREALPSTEISSFEEDDEMRGVFLEEAAEVIREAQAAVADLARSPSDVGLLTTLRRAFHTLKGSSRMVGLADFGDAAWICEQLYNAQLAEQRAAEPAFIAFTSWSLAHLGAWSDAIAARRVPAEDVAAVREHAERLGMQRQGGQPVDGTLSNASPAFGWATPASSPDVPGPAALPLSPLPAPASVPAGFPADWPTAADLELITPAAPAPATEEGVGILEAHAHPADPGTSEAAPLVGDAGKGEGVGSAAAMPGDLGCRVTDAHAPDRQGDSAARSDAESELVDLSVAPHAPQTVIQRLAPGRVDAVDARPDDGPLGRAALDDASAQLDPAGHGAGAAGPASSDADSGSGEATPARVVPNAGVEATETSSAGNPSNADSVEAGAADEHVKVVGDLRINIPLFNIYLSEADELSRRLSTEVAEWAMELHRPIGEAPIALAHSLAGSSATVGFAELSHLARVLEHAQMRSQAIGSGTAEEAALFVEATDEIRRLLHQFAAGFLKSPSPDLLERLAGHELTSARRLEAAAVANDRPQDSVAGLLSGHAMFAVESVVPIRAEGAMPGFAKPQNPALRSSPNPDDLETVPALPPEFAPTVLEGAAEGADPEDSSQTPTGGLTPLELSWAVPTAAAEAVGVDPQPGDAVSAAAAPGPEGASPEVTEAAGTVEAPAWADVTDLLATWPPSPPPEVQNLAQRVEAAADARPSDDDVGTPAGSATEPDAGSPSLGEAPSEPLAARAPSLLSVEEPPSSPATPVPPRFEALSVAELKPLAALPVEGVRHAHEPAAHAEDDDLDAVDAVDPELFPIFEEEGDELITQLAAQLRDWARLPESPAAPAGCMRTLHTLKGGARLAGAMRLGELAHRLETQIEHVLAAPPVFADAVEALQSRCDSLAQMLERLRDPSKARAGESMPLGTAADVAPVPTRGDDAPDHAPSLSAQQAHDRAAASPEPSVREIPVEPAAPATAPDAHAAGDDASRSAESPTAPADPSRIDWTRFTRSPARAAPAGERHVPASQATVRVGAPLLDRLVNLAGEVSITRSRVEAGVVQIKASLGDLTDNLERLRGHLRDIEIQGDMQMSSRIEAAKAAAQTFDPLEFDRFTRFQELTRMMAESVNDVATVQRALQRSLESTEDDLVAQARMTRDLQDDLLRTRMVEFEGISDRLYRVVRQAAKETGKQVRLDIVGGSIEVDRGVLDRMTGSFEHLLRNCVTHGIELPEARRAAGKEPAGSVIVALSHEGNEVGIEFRDDGRGLDLDRIRAKGLEMGLIDENASDKELANLIFSPGFSTASSVTELSGRGVGMDVVRSEVVAMGGRIETATQAGQGTSFKLILPLTTAVTQVVMLRCGDTTVAVPSTLVETVRRVPVAEADAAYASASFTLGESVLPFFWLGALLQSSAGPGDTGRTRTIVIVRSAQQRIAIHVDEVVGNQEVVVKNLGPQLSRLPGLAGMTLLASGAVTLIYNPVALATLYGEGARAATQSVLKSSTGQATLRPDVAEQGAALAPLVLVVDDSLTVRRVTQRMLAREGYRVALAKDGLDAIERLAEERPAIVLSDIEMPRMDGFDLVRNIRADARLAGLPVIMITSRIAQKHRDHASELGVDHYLGKPYSEEDLMALVKRYTARPERA